ncbi:hypothetical protein [Paraliomyxa miuraensis]|uniref:hypothetical protein n=1 Tax=Paraliomyxa miuraensis TaxID=376150 RepID=UPI0022564AB2|nr:hypothetical protein [Paraliomyxa miuraensis]MCX4240908.1 hypothetical protein [Paraliomyxa miuraensis]
MSEPWLLLGDGEAARAVILGPVSPSFDDGAFCSVLSDALVGRGFGVLIVDTPAIVESLASARGLAHVVEGLAERLRGPASGASLLAGYALGGTLAVKLARYLPQVPRILSISGPGFVDAALRRGLAPLMSALEAGQLGHALRLLAESVAPLGQAPGAQHRDAFGSESGLGELAVRRMLAGFRLLFELDARAEAASYEGELLGLVGELSQLATAENQAFTPGPHRRLVSVPGAGMRVLRDDPEFAMRAIEAWLET